MSAQTVTCRECNGEGIQPGVDLLRMDHINSLPQPFMARLYGGSEWPVHDIDVQTGLLRLDVCGKLDVSHIGNVRSFTDMAGVEHEADSFYSDCSHCTGSGECDCTDCMSDAAEAAFERAAAYDGEPPLSADERHQMAWREKQELRR